MKAMAKGNFSGIGKVIGERLGILKQYPNDSAESCVSAVEALCRPTRAKLYGYDIGKNILSDTLNKSRTFRISEAASILISATGENVKPICKAFLKKFGSKSADLKEPMQKRLFFAGGDKNETIRPGEMKYAVLRLLGLNESVAFNQIGMHDENSSDRLSLALSPDFLRTVEQAETDRGLYPLEHPEEFTDVRNALEKVRPYLGNTDIKRIFNDGGIPQHVMQTTGEKSVSPLVDALSSLATALEHGISIGYLYLDSHYPFPSFSSHVIAIVEARHKELQTQKKKPVEGMG